MKGKINGGGKSLLLRSGAGSISIKPAGAEVARQDKMANPKSQNPSSKEVQRANSQMGKGTFWCLEFGTSLGFGNWDLGFSDIPMNDLRFALRQLRKSPGFTLIAVLTLALGIGANTAIFSVIYAVLLQPLPYPEADRLTILTETDSNQPQISVSFPDYVDWKRDNTVFEELAISRRESFNLSGLEGRAPEQISGAMVTSNFFKVIGLNAATRARLYRRGRSSGRPALSVISDRLWQRLFSRDPNVLGRAVNFGNQPYTIIGVMPPEMFSPRTVEVWFPIMRRTDHPAWQTRDNHPGLFGWGRLKEGVTVEKALAEMKEIAARLSKQYPDSNTGVSVTVTPLLENQVGDYRAGLDLLLGAVALVLAHRLRQSRQSSGGSRRGARAGICGSRGGWCVALADHSPAPDGEPRPRIGRRFAWTLSGGMGP